MAGIVKRIIEDYSFGPENAQAILQKHIWRVCSTEKLKVVFKTTPIDIDRNTTLFPNEKRIIKNASVQEWIEGIDGHDIVSPLGLRSALKFDIGDPKWERI